MAKQPDTKAGMAVANDDLQKEINKPERSYKKPLIIIAVIVGAIIFLPIILMMFLLTLGGWLNRGDDGTAEINRIRQTQTVVARQQQ